MARKPQKKKGRGKDKGDKKKKGKGLEGYLKSTCGPESVSKLGSNDVASTLTGAFSTGSVFVDKALGIGGIPKGRITEIFGEEASGKSTLALEIIAGAQAEGAEVLIIDTENALDAEYAAVLGVNINNLLVSQVGTVEDVFKTLLKLVEFTEESTANKEKLKPILVVWDSVAATPSQYELGEEQLDSREPAPQARAIGTAARRVFGRLAKSGITLICVNQSRVKIGGFGSLVNTPGGKSLKFYSTVRIKLDQSKLIGKTDNPTGQLVRFRVEKNKVAAPFKKGTFPIKYGYGIDRAMELFDVAQAVGLVSRGGSWYTWKVDTDDEEKFQYKDWSRLLLDNEEWEEEILVCLWN